MVVGRRPMNHGNANIGGSILLRGVNIGGWLVLERWMTPSLFAETAAVDEWSLCQELGVRSREVITKHRDQFITESDIAWISSTGLNAVRLPVPHWIFGEFEPYIACYRYVDWFLDTCHKYGLQVLLQLHTAPGSQNGRDHSGRQGDITWPKKKYRQKTILVMSRILERYADHPAVIAVGLLNEPDYHIAHRTLRKYYQEATDLVAAHNLISVWSDAFRPLDWTKDIPKDASVWLDCHLYQAFGADQALTPEQHIDKAHYEWRDLAQTVQATSPMIIGEWSAATHRTLSDNERKQFVTAQLEVFGRTQGWFYWSYKTEHKNNWNFRYLYESGVFPAITDTMDLDESTTSR